MSVIRVLNKTRESVLGSRVSVADRWWSRVRGFLGKPEPSHGEGLLLSPCRAIHTWGMRYALDVLFVDRGGRVVALYPALRPRRRTSYHLRAEYAIEVPAGTIEATGTRSGDLLAWAPVEEANAGSELPARRLAAMNGG